MRNSYKKMPASETLAGVRNERCGYWAVGAGAQYRSH
jgi:hypothetical protein